VNEHSEVKMDWLTVDSTMPSLLEHWRRRRQTPTVSESVVIEVPSGSLNLEGQPAVTSQPPDVLIQAVVVFGDRRAEGQVIAGLAVPWFEIIDQLERDPDFLFRIPWRKLEEIIAGAYDRAGWPEVILTPRSGDGGRDVIATRPGVGSIRIVDQVKAYKPGRPVKADEVRSILGVLDADSNVSKGVITTTSRFAPGILYDSGITKFVPYRLELKDGAQLRRWLLDLRDNGHTK